MGQATSSNTSATLQSLLSLYLGLLLLRRGKQRILKRRESGVTLALEHLLRIPVFL